MKKIVFFILSFIFTICVVNAETLDINLDTNNDKDYVFGMLVKDVKDAKINVISGVIVYDEDVFESFDLGSYNGWDLQTVKDGNKVKFVLTHMTDYAVNEQKLIEIKTVVTENNKELKLSLENIVSSSSNSVINVSDVSYKHEVVETPSSNPENVESEKTEPEKENDVQVPDDDLLNEIEGIEKEENKDDKKDEKKKDDVSARDIVSLIISFLVLGAVIAVGVFVYRENKKDGDN